MKSIHLLLRNSLSSQANNHHSKNQPTIITKMQNNKKKSDIPNVNTARNSNGIHRTSLHYNERRPSK